MAPESLQEAFTRTRTGAFPERTRSLRLLLGKWRVEAIWGNELRGADPT